jgi:flagellar FliL protein
VPTRERLILLAFIPSEERQQLWTRQETPGNFCRFEGRWKGFVNHKPPTFRPAQAGTEAARRNPIPRGGMARTPASDRQSDDESVAPAQADLSKKKLAVLAAVAVLALSALAMGGYHVFASVKKEEKPAAVAAKPPAFLDLPEVLVNLASSGGERTQYLKVKAVLELPDQILAQQIQPVMPRVMDSFQVFLRELRASDLDGSAGMYRLREELTRRVNVAIAPHRVNAVLFKELIVQ